MKTKLKVAVYAITKDEEKFVQRWYDSMKYADYIIVMDTGSKDNTIEKFKSLEDGIAYNNEKDCYTNGHLFIYSKIIIPWHFGVARQTSLELCPEDTDIYVSTDLDEFFEQDDWIEILKSKWNPEIHERAVYKYSWSHNKDGSSARIFHYNKIHNKDWVWKYPVHELLCHKTRKNEGYDSSRCCYLFNEIHLHHFPDKTKPRTQYLPLLEARAEEDPNDYYGLIYLAHEYTYRQMYQKSIDTLNKILAKFNDRMTNIEKASCYLFIGDAYRSLLAINKETKDKNNVNLESLSASSYFLSMNIEPTYREAYLGIAKLYLDKNDYEKSIFYAKESLKNGVRHYTWLERDHSWTYEPYDILSLAYYYSGNKMTSLSYAVKALSYDKENERLKNNVDVILSNTSDKDFI